jgi:tRNA(Ile)-lysidine synthase
MAQFLSLEQSTLRAIDKYNLREKQFVLLVSGGIDSMVLLEIFNQLKPLLLKAPRIICIHHQKSTETRQTRFRLRALKLAQKQSIKKGFEFLTNHGAFDWVPRSESEADLREFRQQVVQALTGDDFNQIIVTGHHLNDQLETQMHRLIRGAGPRGLKAMQEFNQKVFRPLLFNSRKEIAFYAKRRKVEFLEDPSNLNPKYFRNWLRHQWLPLLEKRSPGAMKSLTRSFKVLSESIKSSDAIENVTPEQKQEDGFSVEAASFMALNPTVRKLKIYQWIVSLQAKGTGKSAHVTSQIVEEVQRQIERAFLDRSDTEHSFRAGGVTWLVTPRFILCFSDKSPEHAEAVKGFVFTP